MYDKLLVIFVLPALARVQRRKLDADPRRPCDEYAQAEQVHLSYAGPNSLWVTWLTFHNTSGSIVEYGIDRRDKEARASVSSFVDGSAQSKPRFVHRALLDTLEPGKRYSYRVGSECGWSDLLSFVALAPRPDGSFKYAFYGDMGAKNAESVGKLQDEAQNGDFDMVLHIGDFAYNFEDMGDEFMRQVEPIAAYVPYMTVVGNHEYQGKSFPHYKNRFTMPGSDDNLFYSFDLGHAHFIAFSTEFYYGNGHYSVPDIIKQWNWIKDDLEKANDNREKVPWIITMGHRPMYCDTRDQDYCNYADNSMRIGINRNSSGLYQYGLEDLFYAYGVDLELWAHEHIYERMYPVYNRTVFKGTGDPYTDPPAPVHIVAGSAGCKENTDVFKPTLSPWTAFTSAQYGFSRMQVFNETHIYLEQTAALNDTEVDHFWLVKHSHKPYDASDLARLKQFGTFVGSD